MVSPSNQVRLAALEATRLGARLFRANVGLAWVGDVISKTADTLTIRNPRPFKAGTRGMSDSCGWVSVEITPDMVGSKAAVFLAVESKSGKGRSSPDQRAFIAAVRAAGGRAGVSRSNDDTAAIVKGEIRD